jgi:hypothetical protein
MSTADQYFGFLMSIFGIITGFLPGLPNSNIRRRMREYVEECDEETTKVS